MTPMADLATPSTTNALGPETPAPARPAERPESLWRRHLATFLQSPGAVGGLVVLVTLVLASLAAPWIAPQNPYDLATLSIMDNMLPPGGTLDTGMVALLGTDDQGRDMLSAILYGLRISLGIGASSVLIACAIGASVGVLAAYAGGRVESFVMRVVDLQLSFPAILVALLIFGVARGVIPPAQQEQATLFVLIVAIGLSNWAQYARTVRATALVEKRKVYVDAARLIGLKPAVVMAKHVLPNVTGPVLVIATINLALAIIEEATLSFLGVGMPPTQPSLGTLIRIGQQFLFSGEWWILFFPAMALILLALSINLLGDWLRDALNPRLR